jgi:hypothetical protein
MAKAAALILLVAVLGLTACGSSSNSSSNHSSADALSAEAKSAATGDIPDNQVFLTYRNGAAGYSISYPEGWARSGSARDVTFQDKNNIVHITIGSGSPPTPSSVNAELAKQQKKKTPSLRVVSPAKAVTLKGKQMVKAVYTTTSKPNPVTGKRVQLMVDRYELARGGKVATVDLGTPKGVDNVDAYRLMITSFKWR